MVKEGGRIQRTNPPQRHTEPFDAPALPINDSLAFNGPAIDADDPAIEPDDPASVDSLLAAILAALAAPGKLTEGPPPIATDARRELATFLGDLRALGGAAKDDAPGGREGLRRSPLAREVPAGVGGGMKDVRRFGFAER